MLINLFFVLFFLITEASLFFLSGWYAQLGNLSLAVACWIIGIIASVIFLLMCMSMSGLTQDHYSD